MERRAHPRFRAYRAVRLHPPNTPRVVETLTKDLSTRGMRCISASLFPVASELNVEVGLSTGQAPLSVRGTLAWFRMIPHSEQFDLGITFQEISEQDKRRLSAYLERLSSQSALVHV